MKITYTGWAVPGSREADVVVQGEGPLRLTNGERSRVNEVLLWRIEVGSHEEAMAIRNIRNGWKPYVPLGEPAPCPKCDATYYPEGSATCWNCDHTQ